MPDPQPTPADFQWLQDFMEAFNAQMEFVSYKIQTIRERLEAIEAAEGRS